MATLLVQWVGMEFIQLLLYFLTILIRLLNFAVFARIILSWLPHLQHEHNAIVTFIHDVTEPFFLFVKIIPHRIGMLDISAIYVIILLEILTFLVQSLSGTLLSLI